MLQRRDPAEGAAHVSISSIADEYAISCAPWSCPATRSWRSPRPSPPRKPSSSPHSWCPAALHSIAIACEGLPECVPCDETEGNACALGRQCSGAQAGTLPQASPLPMTKGFGSFRPLTSTLRSGPLVARPSTCMHLCNVSKEMLSEILLRKRLSVTAIHLDASRLSWHIFKNTS